MATGDASELELSEYIRDLQPEQFNARIPGPVARRADQLVEVLLDRARTLGSVTRGELVAALIHTAPDDADDLRAKVEEYRNARVWQTLIGVTQEKGPFRLEARRRGRPRRRRV